MFQVLGVEDVAAAEQDIIDRLAFATRYSSTSLREALDCDGDFLGKICQAWARLIREENTPRK